MKCLCITGATQAGVDAVADLLQQAGMQAPQAVTRDTPIDLATWHEQVQASARDTIAPGPGADSEPGLADSSSTFAPITAPGRLWEQLAGDIFVANLNARLWGWGSIHSTWLLDYWQAFEPRLNFVLVCQTPEQMLASALTSDTPIADIDALIQTWHAWHQQMLRFYNRNPQRCLLVNLDDCLQHPSALVERCATQWKLPLAEPAHLPAQENSRHLALHLARQIARSYPEAASLQQELDATINRLQPAPASGVLAADDAAMLIADYRALREQAQELQAALQQCAEMAELQASTEASRRGLQKLQEQMTAQLAEAHEERELLLLQLHQVQEEMEASFMRRAADRKQQDVLANTVTHLEQENAVLAKQRDMLQKELEQLEQARLASEQQLKKSKQALTAVSQAERQQYLDAVKEKEEVLNALNTLQTKLSRAEHDVARLTQAQADASKTQASTADARLKEAEQENELLLLQLHQVQEELEHYFLQHQDMQKQLQTMQQRMDRMVTRIPDYIDYAAVEVLAADNNGNATWRITGLDAAGRTFDTLQFRTVMQHGMAGFVFSRKEGGKKEGDSKEGGSKEASSPLLRWPQAASKLDELTILTIGSRSEIQLRMQVLLELASGDWTLLQTLTRLLTTLLAKPAELKAPAAFAVEPLRQGLEKLGQFFTDFPQTLRYDQARLKREQVNPDYEHLWLHLDNVVSGNQRWPHLEFRLSCAGIRPGKFGHHPKLEFPEDGSKHVLDSWFDESVDDFGAKLELRFALPDAMDLGIWKRLSKHDQGFIKALVDRLPAILATLQNDGTWINRPWTDWQQLAGNIIRISTASTTPPVQAPEKAPEQVKKAPGKAEQAPGKARPANAPASRHTGKSQPSASGQTGGKPKSALTRQSNVKPEPSHPGHSDGKPGFSRPGHSGGKQGSSHSGHIGGKQGSSHSGHSGGKPESSHSGHIGGKPESSHPGHSDGKPGFSRPRHTGEGRYPEESPTDATAARHASESKRPSATRSNDGKPQQSPRHSGGIKLHSGEGLSQYPQQAATIASRVKIKKAATAEKAK